MSDPKRHGPDLEVTPAIVERPAVVVQNLYKDYILKGASADAGGSRWRHNRARHVNALKGITFAAAKGESIGLIGRNGSGKSTLLKIIAGSESPTEGTVHVADQPTFLGVAPALQGWLTGEQNAYLGLLSLGLTPAEAKQRVPEIIQWSELGEAATRPMSTYSSGMGSKLSFAISTAVKPEILLVDETLSTGDAAFGEKAQERMDALLKQAGNIFLVSHSLPMVKRNCERCIWIHNGDLIADGHAPDVAARYEEFSNICKTGEGGEAAAFLEKQRAAFPRVAIDSSRN